MYNITHSSKATLFKTNFKSAKQISKFAKTSFCVFVYLRNLILIKHTHKSRRLFMTSSLDLLTEIHQPLPEDTE